MNGSLTNDVQETFQNKRILITGASGYLSTNLIQSLKDIDCTIVRLSRRDALQPIEGVASIVDYRGDVACREVWERVLDKVDIVYHMAGQTSVYVADEDPLADMEINVKSMLLLLDVCRYKKIKPLIVFSGTSTEVGIPEILPVNETFSDHPVTTYDLHKLMAEQYLKLFCRQGYVIGASLRLTNVYGPGPESGSSDRGILNQMVRKALAGGPLTIYGKGEFVRDYIFIDDVVSAFLSVPKNPSKINGRHFVIGSGEGHSISQAINLVADRVKKKAGIPVVVEHVTPPPNLSPIESRNFIADSEEFSQAVGWKSQYSLKKGIDLTQEKYSSSVGKRKSNL
jgi:nucleoside-diphosphate-sugar epimerase